MLPARGHGKERDQPAPVAAARRIDAHQSIQAMLARGHQANDSSQHDHIGHGHAQYKPAGRHAALPVEQIRQVQQAGSQNDGGGVKRMSQGQRDCGPDERQPIAQRAQAQP